MADYEYDDALLQTNENLAGIDWDNIEGGGTPAEGTHLCLVKKVGGHLFNFKDYTGPRAKVMLQIVEGPDKGKTIHDDITLPHPQESQGSQKRRVLIAKRTGLIQGGSKDTAAVNWKSLEGRQVLITVEHNQSADKKYAEKNPGAPDKMRTYANVTFDGWQDPAAVPEASASTPAATGATPAQNKYSDI